MALKAEVKTEYPGIVSVKAIENREGLLRENSACGFFGVKRYPGDVFQINKPEEFSPRWMVFVEPDNLPEGWRETIDRNEALRAQRLQEKVDRDGKSDAMVQAELVQLAVKQTILTLAGGQAMNQGKTTAAPSHEFDYGNGMRRKPGPKPKLKLSDSPATE